MNLRNAGFLCALTCLLAAGTPSGLEAASSLVFPRLSYDEGTFTGLAIANLSSRTAEVTLTAYGSDGQAIAGPGFVNPVTLTVGPGQQLARLITEIFGPLPPQVVGWVHLTSPVDEITGFFLFLNSQLTQFDGADLPVPAKEIIFNLVRADADHSTEINLVNPGASDSLVSLRLIRGPIETEKSVNLPGRSVLRFDAGTLFEMTEIEPGAYLRAKADVGKIAGFEFVRTTGGDLLGLNAQSATALQSHLYFPQMVVLEPWKSEIGIVNYTDQPLLLTVTARRADGTLFGPASLRNNPVAMGLEGRAGVVLDIKELFGFMGGSPLDGWIEVESSSPGINGYISYGIPSLGSLAAIATVPKPNKASVFSHIATSAGYFTGLAILNSSTLSANTRVLALDQEGEVLGSYDTVIRPGQRISRLITELIPQTANRGNGMVWVQSDIPLYSSSLFGSERILANVPPQQAPEDFRPDQALAKLKVNPSLGVVQPGRTLQFSISGAPGPVAWSVDGVPGGTAAKGRIDASGRYSAPAEKPSPSFVTVAATTSDLHAGASVDVLTTQELLGDLGLLQSIVYLQSLQRLYEVELLGAAGFEAGPVPASGFQTGNRSELFQVAPPAIKTSVRDFNDNIVKMAAFTSSGEKEFILLLGRDSGNLLRLDPVTRQTQVVYSGMNQPTSVAVDPISRNVLVAEADRITEIGRAFIEAGVPAALVESAARWADPVDLATLAPVAGATGLAVDNCTGEIYFSVAEEGTVQVYNRETGEIRTLVSGLSGPTQLLVVYRQGLPCPETVHLLVVEPEADRISLIAPALGEVVAWISAPGVRDLVFLPEGNPYNGRASIAYGLFFDQLGSINIVEVGDQYGDPPPPPVSGPCVSDAFFDDPNLERVVRQALGLGAEDVLTCEAVESLTELDASSQDIASLNGIEYLVGLEHLDVSRNRVRSLIPAAGLANLATLDASHNLITTIELISNLAGLVVLDLSHNQINDLTPLAGPALTSGTAVAAAGNVRAAQMASLEELYLAFNNLSDIGPLAGLVELRILDLRSNQIVDPSPLLANPGLGVGDQILLEENPLDRRACISILELLNRGVAVTVDVDCSGDLAVEVDSPSRIARFGELLLFQVRVSNRGAAPFDDVTLTNDLPLGTAYRSAWGLGSTCVHELGTVVCGWESLAPGTTRVVEIRAEVRVRSGVLVNTATVEGAGFDADPSNNTDSLSIPLATADLSVSKTASSALVVPEQTLVYTVVVTNHGPDSASQVIMTDRLPSAVQVTSFNLSGGSCSLDTQGATLTCRISELAAGASRVLTIETSVSGGESFTNTVSVTAAEFDPVPGNNTATATSLLAQADLAVVMAADPVTAVTGETLDYEILVANNGPHPANGVTLDATRSEGTPLVAVSAGFCVEIDPVSIQCDFGSVLPGQQIPVTVTVLVDTLSPIVHTASVLAAEFDFDLSNNSVSLETAVTQVADLRVTKTADVDVVGCGANDGAIGYTVSVVNLGPSPASGVVLRDSPSPDVFIETWESPPGVECFQDDLTGDLVCDVGILESGAEAVIVIDAYFFCETEADTVDNTATAAGNEFDPDTGNNSVTLQIPLATADLAVTLSGEPELLTEYGELLTLTAAIANLGPDTATFVNAFFSLDSEVGFRDVRSPEVPELICNLDFVQQFGWIFCELPDIAAGDAVTVIVEVENLLDATQGTLTNSVSVGAAERDPDNENNFATEATEVELDIIP